MKHAFSTICLFSVWRIRVPFQLIYREQAVNPSTWRGRESRVEKARNDPEEGKQEIEKCSPVCYCDKLSLSRQ